MIPVLLEHFSPSSYESQSAVKFMLVIICNGVMGRPQVSKMQTSGEGNFIYSMNNDNPGID